MNAKEVVENLKRDNLDSTIKEFILDRTLPLPKKEFIEALSYLTRDSYFKDKAYKELEKLDPESIKAYFIDKDLIPEVALFLFKNFKHKLDRSTYIEMINNFSIPPQVLVEIAKSNDQELLELLSLKDIKLLAHPEIIDVLVVNPHLSRDKRFRLVEMKKRFIEGYEEETVEEEVEKVEEEAKEEEDITIEVEIDMGEGEEIQVLNLNQIKKMTVADKIKLALFGNKEVRKILINDSNRLVREAVLQSPKLTDTEVESFARMKNLPDDVIRKISFNKQWTSKYSVALSLIKNPKTPVSFSLNYLDKLIVRDLKQIQKDRDVPNPVRKKAKILISRKFG